MDVVNQYKNALREKILDAGYTIMSETDNTFRVSVPASPEVAQNKIIALMPSVGDIKAEASESGSLVTVQFRGVSVLNERMG